MSVVCGPRQNVYEGAHRFFFLAWIVFYFFFQSCFFGKQPLASRWAGLDSWIRSFDADATTIVRRQVTDQPRIRAVVATKSTERRYRGLERRMKNDLWCILSLERNLLRSYVHVAVGL